MNDTIKKLALLATRLDSKGLHREADILDSIIIRMANDADVLMDEPGPITPPAEYSGMSNAGMVEARVIKDLCKAINNSAPDYQDYSGRMTPQHRARLGIDRNLYVPVLASGEDLPIILIGFSGKYIDDHPEMMERMYTAEAAIKEHQDIYLSQGFSDVEYIGIKDVGSYSIGLYPARTSIQDTKPPPAGPVPCFAFRLVR